MHKIKKTLHPHPQEHSYSIVYPRAGAYTHAQKSLESELMKPLNVLIKISQTHPKLISGPDIPAGVRVWVCGKRRRVRGGEVGGQIAERRSMSVGCGPGWYPKSGGGGAKIQLGWKFQPKLELEVKTPQKNSRKMPLWDQFFLALFSLKNLPCFCHGFGSCFGTCRSTQKKTSLRHRPCLSVPRSCSKH